jgi:hypothetical protein
VLHKSGWVFRISKTGNVALLPLALRIRRYALNRVVRFDNMPDAVRLIGFLFPTAWVAVTALTVQSFNTPDWQTAARGQEVL